MARALLIRTVASHRLLQHQGPHLYKVKVPRAIPVPAGSLGECSFSSWPHPKESKTQDGAHEVRRVAVVGGGVSGLAATKSCLEAGLEPVCFEQLDDIGGTWLFTDKRLENQTASVHEELVMNTNKEISRFSDFPVDDSMPLYMNHAQYHTYLCRYANHFRLREHINFGTRVHQVAPLTPQSVQGKWSIEYENKTGKTKEIFDAVIVCSGAYTKPNFPDVEGLDKFTGSVLHMHEIRSAKPFKYKKVLVLGKVNSAGDAAVMASRVADEVTLVVGDEGTWIVPRLSKNGLPIDSITSRLKGTYSPLWLLNSDLVRQSYRILNHRKYGLHGPRGPYDGCSLMTNDDIAQMIMAGRISLKPTLKRIANDKAYFSDGSEAGPFDLIICATGYKMDFKFVEWDTIQEESRIDFKLYKWVFPLDVARPSIAVIGPTQTFTSVPPVYETQARWVAQVFAGNSRLPPPDYREAYLQKKREMYIRNFRGKTRNLPWTLMDEFAEEFGAKPTFWRLLLRNPRLAFQYLRAPALPAHYRLFGAGRTDAAWEDSLRSYATIFNPTPEVVPTVKTESI